jgi:hypothetical protein
VCVCVGGGEGVYVRVGGGGYEDEVKMFIVIMKATTLMMRNTTCVKSYPSRRSSRVLEKPPQPKWVLRVCVGQVRVEDKNTLNSQRPVQDMRLRFEMAAGGLAWAGSGRSWIDSRLGREGVVVQI